MKKRTYFILVLGLVSLICRSQTLKKDSIEVNKMIREASTVKSLSGISVISDSEKVAFISNYIDAKNKILKETRDQKSAIENNMPGIRYKRGDKTVVPQIVQILKRKKPKELSELFTQMELDYDGSKKTYVLEPQIATLLFALIEDEMNEKSTMQFLGYNGVQGALPVFEKRLLSGKSTDPDRLFFWLCRERSSDLVINYIVDNYNKDRNFFISNRWSISSLDDCMENGTPQHREKILQVAYDYLDHNNPDFQAFQAISDTEAIQNYYPAFFEIVLKYGTVEKISSLLEKAKSYAAEHPDTMGFSLHGLFAEAFLKTLDPEKKKQAILEMLAEKNAFFNGIETIHDYPETAQPEILAKAFSDFETHNFDSLYINQFITHFEKMTAADFGRYVTNNIHSEILRSKLIHDFNINARSLQENNEYLIQLGLTSKKITAADIENIKKLDPFFENDNSMFSVLQMAGLSVNIDTESDTFPVDYDNLLTQFVAISNGKLNAKAYLQYHYDNKKEQTAYTLLVLCNDKCFIMTPEDMGDWYEMGTFANLLDALTAESNLSEKYNFINTGDQVMFCIFGIPNKVNELVDEYGLSYDTSENNEE